VPYLSALEMCSRRGTTQIHVYLYLYLYKTIWSAAHAACRFNLLSEETAETDLFLRNVTILHCCQFWILKANLKILRRSAVTTDKNVWNIFPQKNVVHNERKRPLWPVFRRHASMLYSKVERQKSNLCTPDRKSVTTTRHHKKFCGSNEQPNADANSQHYANYNISSRVQLKWQKQISGLFQVFSAL